MIRILLADDHALVRDGLKSLFEKQEDMEVVGEADNGRTAVAISKQVQPDVVLMDVCMPDLNGIDAAKQIISMFPSIRVVILSMSTCAQFVSSTLIAGVSGYLPKGSSFSELAAAIRYVMGGKTYLSPSIADTVVKEYVRAVTNKGDNSASMLSPREREVLQLISEGKKTRDISSYLNISVKTVETHRRQIMGKLNRYSVAELTKYAIQEGLTSTDF